MLRVEDEGILEKYSREENEGILEKKREDDEKWKKLGAHGSLLLQWTCNQMVKIL